jgi:secretion/DNA translocation related TadE-like protein
MRIQNQNGQATVITVVFLVVLLGMAALVLDVGSWYRAKRDAQSTADAAALAGAQALPNGSTANATTLAQQYATKNGGIGTGTVTFSTKFYPNDTITVSVKRKSPGFFAKLFGVRTVNVGGTATARSEPVSQVTGVAPITVHYKQPRLHCTGGGNNISCNPDFGPAYPTTLDLEDLHQAGSGSGAGAFGLINLDQNSGGNIGADVLTDWLLNGYSGYLPLGQYNSAPSANFNNSQFGSAMTQQLGHELLFPVYRVLKGPGSNALYDIIGWVGFVPTSFNPSGSAGTLTGYFKEYIADGIQVERSGGGPDLGVHKVELVN